MAPRSNNSNAVLQAQLEALYPGQTINMSEVLRLAAQLPVSARFGGPGLAGLAAAATADRPNAPSIRQGSMLSVPMPEIGPDRMKQLLADLSAQHQQLASSLPFFKQHAADLCAAMGQLRHMGFTKADKRKALLQREPQLLQQIVQVVAAALRQLGAQGHREPDVSRTAAMLCDTLGWFLQHITEEEKVHGSVRQPATPAAAANLRIMSAAGLLSVYAAAARLAADLFTNNSPQIPRLEHAASREHAAAQILYDPVHLYAAAGTTLLTLWISLTRLLPELDILQTNSPLVDTAVPCAALCMALARVYAGDLAYGATMVATAMDVASCMARGVVPIREPWCSAVPNVSVLAQQDVFELLLLGLQVATERVYVEQDGVSRQRLAPNLCPPAASSSGSKAGKQSKQSQQQAVAVPPHHQELLHALLGVREVPDLHPSTSFSVLYPFNLYVAAMCETCRARQQNAHALRAGGLVPWRLVLPLQLVWVGAAALTPAPVDTVSAITAVLADMVAHSQQLNKLTDPDLWRQQSAVGLPPLDSVNTQGQACLESLWLQLGPVLLSLCLSSSGEGAAAGAERASRKMFALFGDLVLGCSIWQCMGGPPSVNLLAVMDQAPLLCSAVAEAVMRTKLAFLDIYGGLESRLMHVSNTCGGCGIAVAFLTEATARACAAGRQAPGGSSSAAAGGKGGKAGAAAGFDDGPLLQQLSCTLLSGFKLIQGTALNGPAGAKMQLYVNRCGLFDDVVAAVYSLLGDVTHSRVHVHWESGPTPTAVAAAGAPPSTEQQLLGLHLLGRSLLAAQALLQQVPSTGGAFAMVAALVPGMQLHSRVGTVLRLLVVNVMCMRKMLQEGGAAAAAVAAGAAGAAAAPVDLARLLQQAGELEAQLHSIYAAFCPADYDAQGNWAGRTPQQARDSREASSSPAHQAEASMSQLQAACQSGGLLQLLHSFGVSCCAAFPQPRCCGNPACTSLEKFSEAGLAKRGCQGCDKVVRFCSTECHKSAWSKGHKAACAVLKQRQGTAAAGAPASPQKPARKR